MLTLKCVKSLSYSSRPPPTNFKSRFIKEHPHLYQKLKETDKGWLVSYISTHDYYNYFNN